MNDFTNGAICGSLFLIGWIVMGVWFDIIEINFKP